MNNYTVFGVTDLRIIAEALQTYSASGAGNAWRAKRAEELAAAVNALADEHASYYDLMPVYVDILPTIEEALEEAAMGQGAE